MGLKWVNLQGIATTRLGTEPDWCLTNCYISSRIWIVPIYVFTRYIPLCTQAESSSEYITNRYTVHLLTGSGWGSAQPRWGRGLHPGGLPNPPREVCIHNPGESAQPPGVCIQGGLPRGVCIQEGSVQPHGVCIQGGGSAQLQGVCPSQGVCLGGSASRRDCLGGSASSRGVCPIPLRSAYRGRVWAEPTCAQNDTQV